MRVTYLANLTVIYGILNRNAVYRRYLNGIMFDIAYCRLYKTSYCSLCPFFNCFHYFRAKLSTSLYFLDPHSR